MGREELEILVVMSNESLTQDGDNGNGKYNLCDFASFWEWKGLGVRGEARNTRAMKREKEEVKEDLT